jgi:tetratricopeptide (TPR) repeat protein
LERSNKDWDYGLFGVNYIPPKMLKSENWKSTGIEKIYYHKGNPIVVLIKRADKSDYLGIKNYKEGDSEKAKILLEEAIESDPNNIWLYAQLLKILLNESNFDSFAAYLQKGKKIYAQYEPFYLLEAQYWFLEGDYMKSKNILNSLFEINPRYDNAFSLRDAVNEKLNMDNQ